MLAQLKRIFGGSTPPDHAPASFLNRVRGVLHVGANQGQEAALYAAHQLNVLWVEPIPEVFETLSQNIQAFPRQHAVCALASDVDGREYDFHISNNEGLSSSIFELNQHKDIWPEVAYSRTIKVRSKTLPSMLRDERQDLRDYDALIMDVQGSELLILRGAESLLPRFKYIKTEAADFESYTGGCTVDQLRDFLGQHGFREVSRTAFAERPAGGTYYDVLFSSDFAAA